MDYLFAPEAHETEDFLLRSFMPGDGQLLFEARNASYEKQKHFLRWENPKASEEDCEKIVRLRRAKYLTAEDFCIGIFSPDGKTLLGDTGYHLRMGHGLLTQTAFLNMWIRASKAGQGLGSAVLKAMILWGFTKWPWERLTWMCDERNEASKRIAQKAGLQQEGTLRSFLWYPDEPKQNLVCFGILKDEFLNNHT